MSGKARFRLVIPPTTSITARHTGTSTNSARRTGGSTTIAFLGLIPCLLESAVPRHYVLQRMGVSHGRRLSGAGLAAAPKVRRRLDGLGSARPYNSWMTVNVSSPRPLRGRVADGRVERTRVAVLAAPGDSSSKRDGTP
jgi:hypothetical protein